MVTDSILKQKSDYFVSLITQIVEHEEKVLLFDNNVKNEVDNLAFEKRDDSFFKVGQNKGMDGEEKDIVKIMKERHQNLFELSNALPVWQTDLTDEYRQDSHYTR